ncbi:reverse transcriptase [Tanacetum coccineum]
MCRGSNRHCQHKLLVTKPTSLGDAFSLARITVARLKDQGVTPPTSNLGVAPLSIKWISPAERPNCHSKSLCFNCDNKWVHGHKCLGKFLLLMTDEDEVMGQSGDGDQDDTMESGDISILNSLVGHGSPRSLQLWGTLGSVRVHILIDNRSTHNFVQPGVVERMHLPITCMKAFKVYVGGGETLLCKNMCIQVTIDIQGLHMDLDLYVLPRKGPDIALGIQCLQKLCKVTHDYSMQIMEFTWLESGFELQGDDSLRMKQIILRHMRGLFKTDHIYVLYELYNLISEEHELGATATAGVEV